MSHHITKPLFVNTTHGSGLAPGRPAVSIVTQTTLEDHREMMYLQGITDHDGRGVGTG